MSEKYSQDLFNQYFRDLKKKYPHEPHHILEAAILQYLFLDCEQYKPEDGKVNELYENAKEQYKIKEYQTVTIENVTPIEIQVQDLIAHPRCGYPQSEIKV